MPTLDAPEIFRAAFAHLRPPSDVLGLAQVHRVLRARLLERKSEPLRFGRYEVLRFLGAGGHGTVYEALDPELRRRVALKILRAAMHTSETGSSGHETHLLHEARVIARVSDARVVDVYDILPCPFEVWEKRSSGQAVPAVCMVTEYVEGSTLRQWLTENNPRPALLLRVFREAARGLIAVHRAGLVHGDFKPSNVMITPSGSVKILDFGIARVVGASLGKAVVSGTPGYASPEQRAGLPLDGRSDQYSFAVTLYETIHGTRPIGTGGTAPVPMAGAARPDNQSRRLAPKLDPILRRALCVSPDDRFESMEHLVSQLEEAYPHTRPRRLLLPLAVGGVALLAFTTDGRTAPTVVSTECIRELAIPAWNATRASELEQVFSATGLPYARDSWQSVLRELGVYEERFSQVASVMCKLKSEPSRDGRVAPNGEGPSVSAALSCLHERRKTFGSLLDVMAERPKDVLPHAVDAVFSLPAPAGCLAARPEPGPQRMPTCAAGVEGELYALDAGLTAGSYHDGVSRSGAARAAALECAPRRLGPWAELVHGLYLLDGAQPAEAASVLRMAFLAAESSGDTRTAMRAITAEIAANDERGGEDVLVNRLIEDAGARSNAAGNLDPDLRADFLEAVSCVRRHQGRFAEAFELAEQALRLRQEHWGAHHPLTSRAKRSLADVCYRQRNFRCAEAIGRDVLETTLRYVGPSHPDVAGLHTLLGNIAWRRGQYESALSHFTNSQRIWSQLFGPDDERAIDARTAEADVHLASDQFAEAWSTVEPLLARRRTAGVTSALTAGIAETAASALTGLSRYAEASELLDFATLIRTELNGRHHPNMGYVLLPRGRLELARGDSKRARESCDELIALWRRHWGDRYPKLSWAFACRGLAELKEGNKKAAAATLKRARALFDSDVDDPNNLAEIEFGLAQSLAEIEPERARVLAAKSAEFYLQSPAHKSRARPVLAWQQRTLAHRSALRRMRSPAKRVLQGNAGPSPTCTAVGAGGFEPPTP